jgi:hypothetical protein
MQALTSQGYTYMVVARERSGRFMAPRQSRASNPEAAIRDTVSTISSDRESWEDVRDFVVLDLAHGVQLEKKVVTETPEPIVTVTYERT